MNILFLFIGEYRDNILYQSSETVSFQARRYNFDLPCTASFEESKLISDIMFIVVYIYINEKL